jgi:hypothetical protein
MQLVWEELTSSITAAITNSPRKGALPRGNAMYYISHAKNGFALSSVKKRLSDFNGTEGERYHVRKQARLDTSLQFIPVYEYREGKLRKTNETSIINLFNF